MRLVDGVVHHRLRVSRFVTFVVPPAAIGIHVDDHIAFEFATEIHGQIDDLGDRLGVFAVDMEDRYLQHLGHVGSVGARAGFVRFGGKTDLVIQNDVQRAAGLVALEFTHVERFLNNALAGKGCVAVNENRHELRMLLVAHAILLGSTSPLGNGVHVFQVTGIKTQRNVDLGTGCRGPVAAIAQVIADVAGTAMHVGTRVIERPENALGTLAENIGQHVQAAAVGHAQQDSLDVMLSRLFQSQVQQRDQAFRALQRKGLGTHEFAPHELFENSRIGQTRVDPHLHIAG